MNLHFDLAAMIWLADHRMSWLTSLLAVVARLGDVEGYIVVSTFIYVAYDKTLGVRLTLIASLTMCLNHALKLVIANPRPFILEGTHLWRWAVSPEQVHALAAEFSTPSGNAMTAAAFYTYLYAVVRVGWVRATAIVSILGIGMARPYLGVHYIEDILIGWSLGILCGLIAISQENNIAELWRVISIKWRTATAIAAGPLVVLAFAIVRWQIDLQPRLLLGYVGAATGVLIGRHLELRLVSFDPQSGTWASKLVRFVLTIAIALGVLSGLGRVCATVA
ncbi:phosphatase PAP2 family protein [Bradyrhizobium sp. CCBAU 45384]|uniref:phosphatase PAP2 family protein n=1 Tax=Bradyrhizobium sp. CCBAU 45384 TaxID=858428 RepID=UPI0023065597|nr:phosphatase PAP2 family protein [Bradyrhizobium sp. CCBAU 45384]MDA9411587.1 hypothetical protein [Bradyrhizobium sp. CCBAU 45384]